VRQAVSAVPGVVGAHTQTQTDEPAVQITADIARAARYDLKPGDIRRQTSVLVAGIAVGSYYRQQQIFDVTVWSIPAVRQSLADIRGLLLDTPDGGHVALDKVATVSIQPAASEIDHDQASRYVDITSAVKGRSLAAVVSDVRQRLQSVALPLSFHAEVFSAKEQRQGADRRTLLFVLAAVIGTLFLLQAALQQWGRAALLLITLPLAAVGGLWTALAAGRVLTIGALIGFITVGGVVLRNGILFVRRCRRLEREQETLSAGDVVLEGASGTVVPVVLTAVALVLAALPFVARGTVAGMEILRPFGLVIIGGLVTSTLYSLFVLPALYLHVRRAGEPGGRRRPATGGRA
jgi:Cu/Ag efflux pump CusA